MTACMLKAENVTNVANLAEVKNERYGTCALYKCNDAIRRCAGDDKTQDGVIQEEPRKVRTNERRVQ